ncbi:MAG: PAS domain S-box protein [Deltaproteobacteria bacterium]|nr:PAS domain S-box protein [Deltaproteobacteria bacterium]
MYERVFDGAFQLGPIGSALVGLDGRWIKVNDAACKMLGYAREELLATSFQDVTHPDDLTADLALVDRLLRGEIPSYDLEKRYLRKDGTVVWTLFTVTLLRGEDGAPRYFITQLQDLSARKRLESDVQLFFEASPDLLAITTPDGKLQIVNGRWTPSTGWTKEELTTRPLAEFLHPEDREQAQRLTQGSVDESFTNRFRTNTGEYRWLEWHTRAAPDGRVHCIARDVTSQREAEERFRLAVDEAPFGSAIVGPDGRYLRTNRALREMLGYSEEELLDMTFRHVTHPDDRAGDAIPIGKLASGEAPRYERRKRYVRKNGAVIHVEVTASCVRGAGGEVRFFISQVQEVTEQIVARLSIERLQREVNRQSELARAMIAHIPDGAVFLVDEDLRFVGIGGPALERMLRGSTATPDTVLGMHVSEVANEQSHDPLLTAYRAALADERVRVEVRRDGRTYELSSAAIRADAGEGRIGLVFCYDVTERKKTADQLERLVAEKDVLLKEVHHRVKNNLQVIASILGLHASRTEDARLHEVFDDIRGRIHAIALLHERVYRSKSLGLVDMDEYVGGLVRDISQTAGDARIEVSASAPGITLGVEHAVPVGLLVNELVANAVKHAFPPSRPRGRVEVALESVAPGRLRLRVRDDGIGMPESSDEPSETTSLGLVLVRALVRQLAGELTIERAEGTTFTVDLEMPG